MRAMHASDGRAGHARGSHAMHVGWRARWAHNAGDDRNGQHREWARTEADRKASWQWLESTTTWDRENMSQRPHKLGTTQSSDNASQQNLKPGATQVATARAVDNRNRQQCELATTRVDYDRSLRQQESSTMRAHNKWSRQQPEQAMTGAGDEGGRDDKSWVRQESGTIVIVDSRSHWRKKGKERNCRSESPI